MFSSKYFRSHYFSPKYWAEFPNFLQISTLSSAVTLFGIPKRVNYVLVQAESQNVRYRDDGTAPTATIGLILYAGDPPTKFAGAINLLEFIEVTASAKLNVHFF